SCTANVKLAVWLSPSKRTIGFLDNRPTRLTLFTDKSSFLGIRIRLALPAQLLLLDEGLQGLPDGFIRCTKLFRHLVTRELASRLRLLLDTFNQRAILPAWDRRGLTCNRR